MLFIFSATAWAQNQKFTPSAVWCAEFTHVNPGRTEDYLEQMRLYLLPVLEEDKRENGLQDYKILRKVDQASPEDWNISIVLIYKNYAQMDGDDDRLDAITAKLFAGKERELKEASKMRKEMRVDREEHILQELKLK
jgi:hypothetical protein